MVDNFRDWNAKVQDGCVSAICDILNKNRIPYIRQRMNRPRQQIYLPPFAGHTDALLAVFAAQEIEIEKLRNELYKLRGITKGEWKSEEFGRRGE